MSDIISVLYVCPVADRRAIATDVEREYPSIEVRTLSAIEEAFEVISTDAVECLVIDRPLDEGNDLAFIDRLSATYPDIPCILVIDGESEELARDALKLGATDVVPTSGSAPELRLGNRIRHLVDSRRTERALRQQQAHQRALHDAASDVIVTIDEDSTITSINRAVEDVLGYEREELLGNSLTTLMPDDIAESHRVGLRRYLETGKKRLDWDYVELPGRHEDGHEVPLGVSFGEFTHRGERFFTGVIRDITEPKRLKEELRRERDLKDRIVETSPVGITVIDSDGEFSLANRRAEETLGRPEAELEELTVDAAEFDIVDRNGDPIPESELPYGVVMRTNEPVFDRELGIRRPDGEVVWLSVNAAPIREREGDAESTSEREGDPTEVIVAFTDITERVELERERERMFDRVTDAFFALDDDWSFTYLNERANELINPGNDSLVGENFWEEFSEAVDTTFEERYRHAMEAQEAVSFEEYYPPLESWFEVHAYPSETGLSVYFRDVTERKERQEELRESRERIELILDAIDEYAIFMLDPDGYVRTWNEGAERIKGYAEDEIVGEHFSTFHPDESVDEGLPDRLLEQARTEGKAEHEGWRVRKGGSRFWANVVITALRDDEGDLRGFVKVTRDMTERREYERTLEERERRYRTLAESFPDGAVGLFDEDLRYTAFAGELLEQVGVDPRDRIGNSVLEIYSDDIVEEFEPCFRDVFDGEKNAFEVDLHGRHLWAHTVPIRNGDGEIFAGMIVVQDITERKEQERELEHERERLAALNEVAQQLSDAETRRGVADMVVEAAAETLDLSLSAIQLYDEESGQLRTESRTAALVDRFGDGPLFDDDPDVPWQVFVEQDARVLSDERAEASIDDAEVPAEASTDGETAAEANAADAEVPVETDPAASEAPIRSAIVLPIGEYGVFISVSTERGAFTETDVDLASVLAANSISALDRVERERALREQTDALAEQTRTLERVNRINDVIRGITQELIQASTREEVAQAVCDRISNAESYRFAWIGSHDAAAAEIVPEARAGDGRGYLEGITIETDADPEDLEPAARALNAREPYTQNRIHSERPFEPWRQAAMERGYRSCIAVPLVFEDRSYGVLALYADETDVFNDLEADVLGELGETIGYTLNALERKQALVSDRSVELEFRVGDLTGSLFDFVDEPDVEFEFENVVQRGDGQIHLFFTVRGVTPDRILQYGKKSTQTTDATCLSEDESGSLFEWTLAESSFLSSLLDRGAVLQTIEIETDGSRIVVRIPAGAEIRTFVELFEAEYDDATLVARREVDEPVMTEQEFDAEFKDALTDRQEEVLRTAYSAGFFESPRKSTAKDIAEILGVSQPTVSRHIRAAERKLFAMHFE